MEMLEEKIDCMIMIELCNRYIEQTKEDLPYMAEIDRKREGALFDLVFSIRENLIKSYKERWGTKD